MKLPQIGFGTWDLRGNECTESVQNALSLGYRHIDTAASYDNHQAIGKALKNFDRSSLYITSKIALDEQVDIARPEESVLSACEKALKELGTDYLDLYLIHSPQMNFPLDAIFKAMEGLTKAGKVRKAGVSNYTIRHLEDLKKAGYTPFADQVEFHPLLNQHALLDYCTPRQIKLIAYRPFGKGKIFADEPSLNLMGAKYHKTGAQIILRWLIQKEVAVIPKASSIKHMKENLEIFDFFLTKSEMAQLDGFNQNKCYCKIENLMYSH